ncbi:hypothetical protein, partial [Streptomyces sp. NPDC055085]
HLASRHGHRITKRAARPATGQPFDKIFSSFLGHGRGLLQALGVAQGPVLHAAVAVMDESGQVRAGVAVSLYAHLQCVQREFGVEAGGDLPAEAMREKTSMTNAAYTQPECALME